MRNGVARLIVALLLALTVGGFIGAAPAAAADGSDVVDLFLALQADDTAALEEFDSPAVELFLLTRD